MSGLTRNELDRMRQTVLELRELMEDETSIQPENPVTGEEDETMQASLKSAGIVPRFAALMMDGLILGLLAVPFWWFSVTPWVQWAGWTVSTGYLLVLVFFAVFTSRHSEGQTPAGILIGLTVRSTSDRLLTLPHALARCLVWSLPVTPFLVYPPAFIRTEYTTTYTLVGYFLSFGLGGVLVLLALLDWPNNRNLHDLLTATRVAWRGRHDREEIHGIGGTTVILIVLWLGLLGGVLALPRDRVPFHPLEAYQTLQRLEMPDSLPLDRNLRQSVNRWLGRTR